MRSEGSKGGVKREVKQTAKDQAGENERRYRRWSCMGKSLQEDAVPREVGEAGGAMGVRHAGDILRRFSEGLAAGGGGVGAAGRERQEGKGRRKGVEARKE